MEDHKLGLAEPPGAIYNKSDFGNNWLWLIEYSGNWEDGVQVKFMPSQKLTVR